MKIINVERFSYFQSEMLEFQKKAFSIPKARRGRANYCKNGPKIESSAEGVRVGQGIMIEKHGL